MFLRKNPISSQYFGPTSCWMDKVYLSYKDWTSHGEFLYAKFPLNHALNYNANPVRVIFSVTERTPHAWMILEHNPVAGAWEVSIVWVHPSMRKRGIAGRMYDFAINRMGLRVVTGHLHSKYSSRLWSKFFETQRYTITPVNLSGKHPKLLRLGTNGLLETWPQRLYDAVTPMSRWDEMQAVCDVRLIATRKTK